ncbi:MAG: NAD-dependent epimerase/dehydratase family protein [Gemmatimonadales bacterium]
MNVLVTGADGFAGSWLVRLLLTEGHSVTGTTRPGAPAPNRILSGEERAEVTWCGMELAEPDSVSRACTGEWDAVVHLAAVSGSGSAQDHPARAWEVNAVGTGLLLDALAAGRAGADRVVTVLVISSAEVYGRGGAEPRPRRETDPPAPLSAYAWSKAGAELAASCRGGRDGLRVMVARPFPHTGPGQVGLMVPRWLGQLRAGEKEILAGDPEAIRDYLDVRDVVRAYALLLEHGEPGTVYNVARGSGWTLGAIFETLRATLGADARLITRSNPARTWDVDHLVGDPTRLLTTTGWTPRLTFEKTLTDIIDAEAH